MNGSDRNSGSEPAVPRYTQCTLCQATILPGQRKCEFCGSLVETAEVTAAAAPPVMAPPVDKLLGAMCMLPVMATAVTVCLILRLSLMQHPLTWLAVVYGVAAVGVAVIGALDAMAVDPILPLGGNRRAIRGWLAWSLLLLLLCPVALPLYVWARSGREMTLTVRAVALVGVVFCVSTVAVGVDVYTRLSRATSGARDELVLIGEQQAPPASRP